MTAEILLMVLCLLVLKYTLEAAGTTRPLPRALADAIRRQAASWSRPGMLISVGALVAWAAWVSDKRGAGFVVVFGIVLTQIGVFLAGARWARAQRRASTKRAEERSQGVARTTALRTAH